MMTMNIARLAIMVAEGLRSASRPPMEVAEDAAEAHAEKHERNIAGRHAAHRRQQRHDVGIEADRADHKEGNGEV